MDSTGKIDHSQMGGWASLGTIRANGPIGLQKLGDPRETKMSLMQEFETKKCLPFCFGQTAKPHPITHTMDLLLAMCPLRSNLDVLADSNYLHEKICEMLSCLNNRRSGSALTTEWG